MYFIEMGRHDEVWPVATSVQYILLLIYYHSENNRTLQV